MYHAPVLLLLFFLGWSNKITESIFFSQEKHEK